MDTITKTKCWHLRVGKPPYTDLKYDDPYKCAKDFVDLNNALMGEYNSGQQKLNAEAELYRMIDNDILDVDSAIFSTEGPFITFFVRCSGICNNSALN